STVVSQALAGIPLGELGWIKAHGTGTRLNDAAELHGLDAALGARLRQVPLTSLKPTLGHCLGASGAVETVAAVLSLEARRVPPTLGTMRVDGDLPPMRLALAAGAPEGPVALLLSESFGGRCAALALRAA
ncbi:MAG TPA: hypothetical protein VFX50_04710, partial [Gemmatimonadales bacterium]|nr:hypothetical protein [Gemmatimonadales bacterium]